MKKTCILLMCVLLLQSVFAHAEPVQVLGGMGDKYSLIFSREYPDIGAQDIEDWGTVSNLVESIVTGTANYDVTYQLDGKSAYNAMIKKGYCYPLNASEKITDFYEKMSPNFQKALSHDGKIYAIPFGIFSEFMFYDKEAFEKVGLAVPQTWDDLVQIINEWPHQPEHIRSKYQVFAEGEDYQRMVLNAMLGGYVFYHQAEGKKLTFDTPLFRHLMDMQSKMTTENNLDEFSEYCVDDLEPLIYYGHNLFEGYALKRYLPLPLKYENEAVVKYPAFLYVVVVNPTSKQPQNAVLYVENIIDHMEETEKCYMITSMDEAIESPFYAESRLRFDDRKKDLEEAISKATGEEKEAFEEKLEAHLKTEEGVEKYRFLTDQEDIKTYRAYAQNLFFPGPSLFDDVGDGANAYILDEIERYLEGQLTVDKFVLSLEEKADMILTERGE